MHKNFDVNRLNVKAFARENISLEGLQDLSQFARLVELEAKLGLASEEDLLVLTPELNVWELIEDELIMSAPLVPKHEVCPTLVPMSAVDEAFEEALDARPNPFAALAQLKKKPN